MVSTKFRFQAGGCSLQNFAFKPAVALVIYDSRHVGWNDNFIAFELLDIPSRLNFAAELAYYTPQEVAQTTITAIRKNQKYVSMPPFYQQAFNCLGYAEIRSLHFEGQARKWWNFFLFVHFRRLLPSSFQNLIRDNFKPNVGAAVNEPSTRKSTT